MRGCTGRKDGLMRGTEPDDLRVGLRRRGLCGSVVKDDSGKFQVKNRVRLGADHG